MIDRFRSLPAKRSAYLAGHYLAELAGHGAVDRGAAHRRASSSAGACTRASYHVTGAFLLLFLFCSAMIWVGTWVGLTSAAPTR